MDSKKATYFSIFLLLFIEGVGVCIAYHHHSSLSHQLDQVALDFQNLKKRGFTSSTLAQLEGEKNKYQAEAYQLLQLLRSLQFPLERDVVTPQSFQDKLRSRVSAFTRNVNKKKLLAHFYLGFDSYRSTLPPQEIAAELDRELEVISGLIQRLIKIPFCDILAIHRLPFLQKNPLHSEVTPVKKKIFDLCLETDQPAFRNALNAILEFPHFLSIEGLQVANIQPHTLRKDSRAESGENAISQSAVFPSSTEPVVKTKMRLFFLKERLIITIRIAMIIFTFPGELN